MKYLEVVERQAIAILRICYRSAASSYFFDDHFTANKKRSKELLSRIIDERGKTHQVEKFSAQVRTDIARDPEILDLMKDAGFIHVFIGFESIIPGL